MSVNLDNASRLLSETVNELKFQFANVSGLPSVELASVRDNIATVQIDVAGLKADMRLVKTDIAGLKTDMSKDRYRGLEEGYDKSQDYFF